jgi:dipeptidyl aminopeptidase/acylaminoacyl peptidase
VTEPPQYHIKHFTNGGAGHSERRISNFPHPYPTLKDLNKEILRYKRDDGVELTATLYLPPGYNKEVDGPLPCIVWAYPREFKSKDAAGQLRRSPHQVHVGLWCWVLNVGCRWMLGAGG